MWHCDIMIFPRQVNQVNEIWHLTRARDDRPRPRLSKKLFLKEGRPHSGGLWDRSALSLSGTDGRCSRRAVPRCFDPRPRMGGDCNPPSRVRWWPGFDPRPRMGGDIGTHTNVAAHQLFRSAPPHGGRPCDQPNTDKSVWCFDPRPRMGGDDAARQSA